MKHTVGENALVGERSNFINSRSAQTSYGLPSVTKRFAPYKCCHTCCGWAH